MKPEQFEERLWQLGISVIQRAKMGISRSCEGDFRSLIHFGTVRALSEVREREYLTDGQYFDASQNLMLIVGGMIALAKLEGLTELQEFTLSKSSLFFCPLWPFC